MRRRRGAYCAVLAVLLAMVGPAWPGLAATGPETGPPPGPVAPSEVLSGTAEEQLVAGSRGWVDTSNRSAVAARYLDTFNSVVPAANWTGSVASCQPGTLSSGYRAAILDRINWYRAMAGTLDGVIEEPTFSVDAQAASLIMSANNALSHDPPTSWACWTSSGDNGASKSNLYLGRTGVDAVDGFIEDPGASNAAVGHRSWFLEPTQVRMGVGAIPRGTPVSEAIYVIDPPNLFTPTPPPTREANGFVSWPPRGFVPSSTVYPRWSLHNNNADFSAATVAVTVGGQPVPTTVEHRGPATTSRPGPAITFVPTLPPFPSQSDLVVSVTVSGIRGTGMPSSYSWSTTIIPPPTAPVTRAPADFTGDGRTDVAVFRPSNGTWFVQGGATVPWGTSGDIPVPGDYDGDGDTDIAVFRPSNAVWFVQGGPTVAWGTTGDIPVPGDYDGNGTTDIAVFRPSNGTWFVQGGATVPWGTTGDIPVPGDYDGDDDTDIAVFRPSNGTWFVQGGPTVGFGTTGDIPVPGDYDDDGNTDIAAFRPSTGTWYVQGGPTVAFGTNGDIPVPGDYDGDGSTDVAVFRPSTGTWYVQGGPTVGWGTSGDVALPLPDAIRRFFFPSP